MGEKFSLDSDVFHGKFGLSRWGKEGGGVVGINLTHLRKKAQFILSALLGVHLHMPYCTHSGYALTSTVPPHLLLVNGRGSIKQVGSSLQLIEFKGGRRFPAPALPTNDRSQLELL